MRSRLVPLLVVALTLLAAGAAPAQAQQLPPAAAPPMPPIPPIVWTLTDFPGVGGIGEPGRYTVQFLPDGSVSAHADCNWKSGAWTAGNGTLDITISSTTVAACPADSLEDVYTQALDAATSYTVDMTALVISGPSGDMRFVPVMPGLA